MNFKISETPVFKDYPNARPIDRRRLKKLKDRVYTEEAILYNPFELNYFSFLCKFEGVDIVYIDRRLFKYKSWVEKSPHGRARDLISISKRVKLHRIFDSRNQMLAYKLKDV